MGFGTLSLLFILGQEPTEHGKIHKVLFHAIFTVTYGHGPLSYGFRSPILFDDDPCKVGRHFC